uniref:Fatty acid hydroxylase domain-containing protein n=1 Tax=Chaetoceros debilis TaxID=122233 RepID=A0A7S3VAD9_9STRA
MKLGRNSAAFQRLLLTSSLCSVAAAPHFNDTVGSTANGEQERLERMISGFVRRMQDNGVENMDLMDYVVCSCIIMFGFEFISFAVHKSGYVFQQKLIPVRGKHLDEFSKTDRLYITLNKLATIPFIYIFVKFLYHEPNAKWSLQEISFTNLLLPIVAFFIIYDFFYTLLHWALHIQAIYGYVHKHHHRQKAPSRANTDAVNVNPIEFFLGEYNHLFTIFIYTTILGFDLHVLTVPLVLATGAVLAGLNHTRYDSTVVLPFSVFGRRITIYDSKWHDVHHRIPQSNYGQYTNLWDRIFGTFREYDPNDRVNPKNQLDPKTGKSLQYELNGSAGSKLE